MEEKLNLKQDINNKNRILFLFLLFLPCLLIFNRGLNNDIWFILNDGRYVFQNGIPHIEPFTIHQGFEFVMQQWLSACIFWVIYSSFGEIGLRIVVLLCYALIIFSLYRLNMKVSRGYFFVSFSLTLLASIMVSFFTTERPYIFSTLILVVELSLLESFLATMKNKYLYPLPILSVLLINLHASMWPMLFVVILPYWVDAFHFKIGPISHQGYRKGVLFSMTGLMIVAGFLNPYGIDAMTYLFKSYGYPEISNYVGEMTPPNINTFFGFMIYVYIFIVVSVYVVHRKGTTKLRYILLTLGTIYMTLSSVRNLPFFAISGVFPLAYYLKDFEIPSIKPVKLTKKTLLLRKVLIGLIITLAVFCMYDSGRINATSTSEYTQLKDAIYFILNEKQTRQVKLYTGYNDGGMAEFMGIPSYIDPRAEVFVEKNNKKADVMKEYFDLQSGALYYKQFLEKYQFTHIITTKNDILYISLKHDQDYQLSFSNKTYSLFEKKRTYSAGNSSPPNYTLSA
jgi:hypothetical protein